MKLFEIEDFGDFIVYKDHSGSTWKREDDDLSHKFYMLKDGALGDESWHYEGCLYKKLNCFYEEYEGISVDEAIHYDYIEKSLMQDESED